MHSISYQRIYWKSVATSERLLPFNNQIWCLVYGSYPGAIGNLLVLLRTISVEDVIAITQAE